MRWIIAAIVLAAAGAAAAQPARPYDVYILERAEGVDIYALTGPDRAIAIEVRGCGDVSVISDPAPVIAEMRAHRARDEDIIIVSGRGSHVNLGACGDDEDDEEDLEAHDDGPSLIVVEGMTAAQVRRTLRTLDAAPASVREQMLDAVGL